MSGKYQAYPEYKDSGVEWLGKLPTNWGGVRLKYLAPIVTEKATDRRNPLGLENIESWTGKLQVTDSEFQGDGTRFIAGDLLFGKLRPYLAKVLLAQSEGEAVGDFHVLRPLHNDSRYLQYQMLTREFISIVDGSTYGAKMPRASWEFMGNLTCSRPSLIEQRTIAAFLDHETARIDRLIEKQQRLIELLKEKRQAVISHAVSTNSTEPTAKLGYFVDLLPGYAFPSSGFEDSPEGNVKLLRGTNVGVGSLRWDDVVYWPSCDRMKLKPFELEAGDIVFGMDRPWISSGARVAEVLASDLPCLLLQRVARIRTHENTYQPFVKMCLASHEFKSYVESDLTGVSVPHISPEQIKNFPIRAIGFENQKWLTDEVNRKLEKFNRIEAEAIKAIILMQERRIALISAAVTGKIDVRNWQPNTSTQSDEPDLPMAAEQAGRYHV
jgi:type I restriction enzyme S subunit